MGIVNGTTNFILTKMSEEGRAFADALAEAQAARLRRGRPERGRRRARRGGQVRDPRVDRVQRAGRRERRVPRGHRERDPEDIEFARAPRLRGEAARDRGDRGRTNGSPCRVHAAMIPASHPLASVRDAYNAVFVEGPERRRADVLRPRRRRGGHGDRRRGRPRQRRAQPARGCPRPGLHVLLRADGSARWTR